MRVYVVGKNHWCGPSTAQMFAEQGHNVVGDEILSSDPNDIDLVVFTGGSDISPYIYGEENISSSCDVHRDEFELEVYRSLDESTKKAGICRGGQLLNALNGGKLIQDHGYLSGPKPATSAITAESVGPLYACHHQGILCPDNGLKIARIGLNNYKTGTVSVDSWPVYACYFPEDNALCVQWHPEWGHSNSENYFNLLMNEYLFTVQQQEAA